MDQAVENGQKMSQKEVLEKLDYLIGNTYLRSGCREPLPQIQRRLKVVYR